MSRVLTGRTRPVAGALLVALAALGCGDDGGNPPGIGVGNNEDASTNMDAGSDAGSDTGVVEPTPTSDSGADAEPPRADAEPPDEDGGEPTCGDLDCASLSDECNVGVCDAVAVACRLEPRADGTECGDQTLDNCTAKDTCQQGECRANHQDEGTPCGDQDEDCRVDDECDGEGHCVDSGFLPEDSACGDPTNNDCDDADTCDDQGVCQPNYADNDSLCGDVGEPCRHDDRCDGQGQCVNSGNWDPDLGQCPMGEYEKDGQTYCQCGSSAGVGNLCYPGPDVCIGGTCQVGYEQFAPNGITTNGVACGNGVPTNAQCDMPDQCLNGQCEQNGRPPGMPCGDQATNTTCNRPDTCDGFGNCDSRWASDTTVCGGQAGDCLLEPRCTGTGGCAAAAPAPEFTSCGDPTVNPCNGADDCDGSGGCRDHFADAATTCGSPLDTECTDPDTCDGAGQCDPNHANAGTQCGDFGLSCAVNDSCNAGGVCVDNGVISPCTMQGRVMAGGVGVSGLTVEVVGGDSATTNGSGEYELDVPVAQRFLMHVEDTAGYWGLVRVRSFTPAQLENTLTSNLDDDAEIEAYATEVDPDVVVDRSRGLVTVAFVGSDTGLGEGATLNPSGAAPIMIGDNGAAYSSMNTSEEGFMNVYNIPVGTTNVTPVNGSSNACALQHTPASGWPIFAHTVTIVPVQCD